MELFIGTAITLVLTAVGTYAGTFLITHDAE